jgi:fructose-1,6-bisphosphatase/inositol monophosphatase family enzyme
MPPAPDPQEFVRVMTPAVRHAAEVARGFEGRVHNQPKLAETTAVKQAMTVADAAAQDVLLETLAQHWPDVGLAAEEDTPAAARFREDGDGLVIIDPIDGTLHSYLNGSGPYAVIIGLAIEGALRAGIVAMPREGLVFAAALGAGAWMARAGGELHAARAEPGGARILVSHQMPASVVEALRERDLEVVPSCGGAIAVAPLVPGVRAGLRWTDNPQGVSVRGRVGTLIAQEAGALVATDGDRRLSLEIDQIVATVRVASTNADLKLLADCLRAGGLGSGPKQDRPA